MLKINKLISASPIDFAAEELKKYLRMMMPEGGDIEIAYDPEAKCGFRLGLMQDLGLDISDAEDAELDDILYIDCDKEGGIIAGSNPRSVLLAVYEYLRQNGCRWLMPGVDGEYIPMKDIEPVKYRHKPSMRFRGWCNEGAEYQQSMLETIDFSPKVGNNVYMMEFKVPPYYRNYYGHYQNEENRASEHVTDRQIVQWKRQCEAEIAKRGLQFHDIGHGFNIDPFGIGSAVGWSAVDESAITDEQRRHLAMINGKRGLYFGKPTNTNFCMSNPDSRRIVSQYVADYAEAHSNIDYLHVWLADAYHNHCECAECRKKTPSDWYMVLMNDIDKALEERNLKTRIVFIVYVDTTWAPITERIKNPKRFSILLAPISRSYLETLPEGDPKPEIKPFVLNQTPLPATLAEYFAHFAGWREFWHGSAFAYEYHFWWHLVSDVGGISLSRRISEDIRAYENHKVNGIVEDGTQRAFFPTGLVFYTYARTLFDTSLSPEDVAKEYFSAAFGEDGELFRSYLEKIGDLFDVKYMEGKLSANEEICAFYNPAMSDKLASAEKLFAEGEELIKSHYNSDCRVRTVSVRLLEFHLEYCRALAKILERKAVGDDDGASELLNKFRCELGRREAEYQLYYDHNLHFNRIRRIVEFTKTNRHTDHTQI